jgi:hypothetical protein
MSITLSLASCVPCRHPEQPAVVPRRLRPAARRAGALLARERARLRAHFRAVLAELSGREVGHLSAAQRAMRSRLLDELARYARAGRFPRNLDFPKRQVPYFVDAFGTRCAMAHLIESTGAGVLVARVASAMNNAWVHELSGDRALQEWLDQAGLSAAEAARIQPSYCFVSKGQECFCSSVINPVGMLEATVVAPAGTSELSARVDAIHGNGYGTTVGQQVMAYGRTEVGGEVLIQVAVGGQGMPWYGNSHGIKQDGTVDLSCRYSVPALTKADAIAAALAPAGATTDLSPCAEHLRKLDARWGESICEVGETGQGSAGGCSVGTSATGSPWLLGTALALAAVWSARRRVARPGRRRKQRVGVIASGR